VEEFYEETDPLSMISAERIAQGERMLMLAILEQAVVAFKKHTLRSKGILTGRNSVWPWIQSNDTDWPFSFENICEHLNLDPNAIRTSLLKWAKSARSNQKMEIRRVYRESGTRTKVRGKKTK
jgi:hypothetical protein